jgi:hypothetical protein
MNHDGHEGTPRKTWNFAASWFMYFFLCSTSAHCLVAFDQFANSERVGLTVAMAGDGIAATGGIDANI